MFKLMIDTCVWLDLAKNYNEIFLLDALDQLIRSKEIELILPRVVLDEFANNKNKIVQDNERSFSGAIKRTREAVAKFGDGQNKTNLVRSLDDLDQKIRGGKDLASHAIKTIEALFSQSTIIDASDSIKLRAFQRGIEKKAPFHRAKNGLADALIIESYIEVLNSKPNKNVRFAFITHNVKDFSHESHQKNPHQDIASIFSKIKSLYFVNLGEALHRIQPEYFSDLIWEQTWHEEHRRHTEITDAIDELVDKVWYSRHKLRESSVKDGFIRLVSKNHIGFGGGIIHEHIWKGALKAAKQVERRYGLENLGPWDDFEWGMINGKLSALRWVLGDEWDFLDT